MATGPLTRHRRRQGLIIALLLLGPAPIAVQLFAFGTGPAHLALVLAEVALLVAAMLALYRRQRAEAPAAGLPVLPALQVGGMLVVVGAVSGAVFLLPSPGLAPAGFACVVLAVATVYAMGLVVARKTAEPDERSAVLVLGLMAALIAFGNALL